MRKLDFKWAFRELVFRFEAGTSRGIIKTKPSYFVKLFYQDQPEKYGIGEAGLIEGLSPDFSRDYEQQFRSACRAFCNGEDWVGLPSTKMALETAFYDLINGGQRLIFDNGFANGEPLPINGLIWMGSFEQMRKQIDEKITAGFNCIKMKVGAIDFDLELELLRYIRQNYGDQIVIRVDANGAFGAEEALKKLNQLSQFNLHSIEQPIGVKNYEKLKQICKLSAVAVALDEELFSVWHKNKLEFLDSIGPQYLVLKPTLLGGFDQCGEWIEAARELGIGYWLTSALESNIGLNAISQFASGFTINIPQGLGTGALFENNIVSPLEIKNGFISYNKNKSWDIDLEWR